MPRPAALLKPAALVLAAVPLGRLVAGVLTRSLGTNPTEVVIRSLGTWALVFLCLALAVTPLRRMTGWSWPVRLRRMLGLYAFFYAVLHVASYAWLDRDLDLAGIVDDVLTHPYIVVGLTSFVLLIPLAATSTDAMVRRLGAREWQALHRFAYVIAVGAVVHFWLHVKRDVTEPAIYALVVALLLGWRLFARGPGGAAPALRALRAALGTLIARRSRAGARAGAPPSAGGARSTDR